MPQQHVHACIGRRSLSPDSRLVVPDLTAASDVSRDSVAQGVTRLLRLISTAAEGAQEIGESNVRKKKQKTSPKVCGRSKVGIPPDTAGKDEGRGMGGAESHRLEAW